MIRKIAAKIIAMLTPLAYEPMKLDGINKKLVEPLPGLPGYFRFVSTADMPEARFVHYLHLVRRLEMNVDEDLLNKYLEAFKKSFEGNDKQKFYGAMYMLEDTMKTVTPIETYYWLAALCYFKEDEDLSTFDYDVNKRKVEYFKGLPQQSFFLASLLMHLKGLGQESLKQIESSLTDSQVKGESYERILTELIKSKSSES